MRLVFVFPFWAILALSQQMNFQGAAQGQLNPVPADCAVDGTVVNKATGEAIPRAVVGLMGKNGANTIHADNTGRFAFSNINCGAVQIIASRPGFLSGFAGAQQPGRITRPAILAPGSSLHDLKIELIPQAVVTGRILDDLGDPESMAQINVWVSRVVQGARTFQIATTAVSNDLGEFRLSGLAGGRYIVCARGSNRVAISEKMSGESCYPGPLEGGASSAMEVASGSEFKVDLTVHTVRSVHISGTVTGIPKNQGLSLNLIRTELGGLRLAISGHPTTIQPDGKFEIRDVTPGSYVIAADYNDQGKRLMARMPIEVGSTDIEGVNVRIEPGLTVTGTVRYQSKGAMAEVNPYGQQFNVNLLSGDAAGGGGVQWNKDHTAFTMKDLAPGNYRLEGYAPGKFYIKSATLGGRDISRAEIPILQSAGPIDLVLSDDSGSLEGQVTDAGDQPALSWVMIIGEGLQPRNVMTDAAGKFKVPGLAPGEYRVYAWDDVQQVEYENSEWMRHYPVTVLTIEADQSAKTSLRQSSVATR